MSRITVTNTRNNDPMKVNRAQWITWKLLSLFIASFQPFLTSVSPKLTPVEVTGERSIFPVPVPIFFRFPFMDASDFPPAPFELSEIRVTTRPAICFKHGNHDVQLSGRLLQSKRFDPLMFVHWSVEALVYDQTTFPLPSYMFMAEFMAPLSATGGRYDPEPSLSGAHLPEESIPHCPMYPFASVMPAQTTDVPRKSNPQRLCPALHCVNGEYVSERTIENPFGGTATL